MKANQQLHIFLHVPKTAGSTLTRLLHRLYSKPGMMSVSHDWDPVRATRAFNHLPQDKQDAVRLFAGHFHFGVHEFLPSPATYFTILRDPVERVISHYYFVLGDPNHQEHNFVVSQKMSLLDYVTSGLYPELDNGQTRMLAGRVGLFDSTPFGTCGESLLSAAEENLTRIAFVGTMERFDHSLLLLQKSFSWKTPYYVRLNVTAKRASQREIPQDTLDAIHEYTQLDHKLYALVKDQLERSVSDLGPSFIKKVARFRMANKRYNAVYALALTYRAKLAGASKTVVRPSTTAAQDGQVSLP